MSGPYSGGAIGTSGYAPAVHVHRSGSIDVRMPATAHVHVGGVSHTPSAAAQSASAATDPAAIARILERRRNRVEAEQSGFPGGMVPGGAFTQYGGGRGGTPQPSSSGLKRGGGKELSLSPAPAVWNGAPVPRSGAPPASFDAAAVVAAARSATAARGRVAFEASPQFTAAVSGGARAASPAPAATSHYAVAAPGGYYAAASTSAATPSSAPAPARARTPLRGSPVPAAPAPRILVSLADMDADAAHRAHNSSAAAASAAGYSTPYHSTGSLLPASLVPGLPPQASGRRGPAGAEPAPGGARAAPQQLQQQQQQQLWRDEWQAVNTQVRPSHLPARILSAPRCGTPAVNMCPASLQRGAIMWPGSSAAASQWH